MSQVLFQVLTSISDTLDTRAFHVYITIYDALAFHVCMSIYSSSAAQSVAVSTAGLIYACHSQNVRAFDTKH